MFNFYTKIIVLTSALVLYNINAECNITIAPVRIEFNPSDTIQSLTIKNQSNILKNFQVKIYKIKKNSDNKDQEINLLDTKDFIATPLMFKITSGLSQLIRIVVINQNIARNDKIKKEYILEIKEISVLRPGQKGVEVLTRYLIPIYL